MKSFLRAAGSLWLAAAILLLLMIAMGAATVVEATQGTPAALRHFYKAGWFQVLLALLALNALAALLARYPYTLRQMGFVLTHGSILLILAGAWVTHRFGIDGQLGIEEGRQADQFTVAQPVLVVEQPGRPAAQRLLNERLLYRAESGDYQDPQPLTIDDLRISIRQYFADSREKQEVHDDNPQPQLAVEAAIRRGREEASDWIFAGRPGRLGSLSVTLHQVATDDELARRLAPETESATGRRGTLRITFQGQSTVLELGNEDPAAINIPGTAASFRVLRYLPHAVIDRDQTIRNASDRPVNPAIEIELQQDDFRVTRWAFSRFPQFWSEKNLGPLEGLQVVFEAAAVSEPPASSIELMAGPSDRLYVRFAPGPQPPTAWIPVTLDQPIETPWTDLVFSVRARLERARLERYVEAVDPPREDPEPALVVEVAAGDTRQSLLIPKYESRPVTIAGRTLTVGFRERSIPLGFTVALDRFVIGRYPGTERPRSFESHVRFLDPAGSSETSRIISMNHPASCGDYTFFQSSYRQDPRTGRSISFLSVSWDPGQPIVFAGYVGITLGMLWVLVVRSMERRRLTRPAALSAPGPSSRPAADIREGGLS